MRTTIPVSILTIRRALLACALLLSASAVAEVPAPWARWVADPNMTTPEDLSATACADATGNGHTLSVGVNLLPIYIHPTFTNDYSLAHADIRGNVFAGEGSGGTYASFSCPALKSRAFACWIKPYTKNHNYGSVSDLSCLLNGFSGMTIYSIYTQSVWHVAFGTRLAKEKMSDDMQGLSVFSDASVMLYRGELWQHLVFSLEDKGAADGAGNRLCDLAIYRNGELVASESNLSVPAGSSDTTCIGNATTWCGSPFVGRLDDIRVWTNSLSAADAKALYEDTRVHRLLGYWPMDEIKEVDGRRITPDKSGMGRDMELGSLVCVTNGMVGAGALFFNAGTVTSANESWDSYGLVSNGTYTTWADDISIAMWVKRDRLQSTSNGARLFRWKSGSAGFYVTYSEGTGQQGNTIADSTGTNPFVAGVVSGAAGRSEEWFHTLISYHYSTVTNDSGKLDLQICARIYRNGELFHESEAKSAGLLLIDMWKPGSLIYIANADSNTRPFRGTLDDMRMYVGELSADEVRAIYRGPAKVSAGEDFAVASSKATLHGEVSACSINPLATGYAGEPQWILVSAPVGGEGAEIENPKCATTAVTLPVVGEYVFAMSNEVAGVSYADEVTVTRLATGVSAAPTISVAAGSTTGLCAVVNAVVGDGVRVRWSKKSGPGAVWFGHDSSTNTVATFGVAGTYELECVAETDGGTATGVLGISVSGPAIEETLDGGLGMYVPFKLEEAGVFTDLKRGVQLDGNTGYAAGLETYVVPGVAGGYGCHLGNESGARLKVYSKSSSSYTDFDDYFDEVHSSNGTPKEPYNTISCWLYHDSNDTNIVWMSGVCHVNYSYGVHYLSDNGMSNDFAIRQNKSGNKCLRFKGPAGLNYTNRWIHLVAQVDNHKTGGSEVWVNGIKLTETSGNTLDYGRTTGNGTFWGGGIPALWVYPAGDPNESIADVSCTKFPGLMDEIRMYRRKLSEAEIRYLYEHPVPSSENAAPVVEVPLSGIRLVRRKDAAVPSSTFDDGRPQGSTLSYKWSVAKGDSTGLRLVQGVGAELTVTGLKAGEYSLQLVASDGERNTYSALVPVSIKDLGTVIVVK